MAGPQRERLTPSRREPRRIQTTGRRISAIRTHSRTEMPGTREISGPLGDNAVLTHHAPRGVRPRLPILLVLGFPDFPITLAARCKGFR